MRHLFIMLLLTFLSACGTEKTVLGYTDLIGKWSKGTTNYIFEAGGACSYSYSNTQGTEVKTERGKCSVVGGSTLNITFESMTPDSQTITYPYSVSFPIRVEGNTLIQTNFDNSTLIFTKETPE